MEGVWLDVKEILNTLAVATKTSSSSKGSNGEEKVGKVRDDPLKCFNRFGVLDGRRWYGGGSVSDVSSKIQI